MNLVFTPTFQKKYKKYAKNNPNLKNKIENILELIKNDYLDSKLKTHRLKSEFKEYRLS